MRSVCLSATARRSVAFSVARIRNDIRLLSSTATLGMASFPGCTHSNGTRKGNERQLSCTCGERAIGLGFGKWSGRPDSNRRHRPWQGRTLPAELLPRGVKRLRAFARRFCLDCFCPRRLRCSHFPHLVRLVSRRFGGSSGQQNREWHAAQEKISAKTSSAARERGAAFSTAL